jgi:two-component system, LytTR family, sensor kinase
MTVSTRLRIVYPIITGAAVIGFFSRYFSYPEWGLMLHFQIFTFSLLIIAVMFEFHLWLNHWLQQHLPIEKNEILRILAQLSISIPFMLLIKASIYDSLYIHIPVHMDRLSNLFVSVIYVMLAIGINVIFFAQYYFKKWKEQIQFAERLEREKTQVQFDNLKNQINPHFLFNALTSLNSLIFENQELASTFLQQLSKVYRYVLQNDKPLVNIEKEMDFVKHYMALLKTRLPDAIEFAINIKKDDLDKYIPPVTLQILIENALKHNIANKEKPLKITILTDGKHMEIKNNLQKKSIVETSNKQGLNRLKSLYSFLSDEKVEVKEEDGFFVVQLPLIT